MIKSRRIDAICCAILAVMLVITALFINGDALGITAVTRTLGYEEKLFDSSVVHTLDIVMDDWDGFLETCTNEEYTVADLVIDGESVQNVGLRAKGNTSLTSVANYGNDRYSLKIEVDHYDSGKNYYGLDKFCLNNIIQDNTYLKDFLVYTMMGDMGVASPLCSFVYITVNGEDWGLYLAVEGVEESFLTRNYGTGYGELYKPDSVSIGGGRGNGQNFDMEKMFAEDGQETESAPSEQRENWSDTNNDVFPQLEDLSSEDILNALESAGLDVSIPDTVDQTDVQQVMEAILEKSDMREVLDALQQNGSEDSQTRMGKGGGGGMSSEDTLLQYIDDDPDSYSNIFSSAKTDITDADKQRLITSLKTLSGIVDGTVDAAEAAEVIDIESVIRYFVVHNFVCNGDSYTGSIVHNYYLYEENGVMEMIPWDYNLAFGGFSGGGMGSSLTSEVNSPIDTPVSSGDISERPMVAWIFSSEEYADLYHQIYAEFIEKWFDSGYFEQLFDQTVSMISAYVEKDPTAFCSYNEFEEGVSTLRQFCLLRAQSVSGQLDGTIPSTQDGQNADSSMLIDASSLDAEAMGGQSMGGMPGGGGGMMSENGQKMPLNSESFGQMSDGSTPSSEESADGASSTGFDGEVADRPADPSDGAEGPSDMKAPIGSEDTGGAVSTDLDENSMLGQMESITSEESPSSDDNVQPEQQSEEAFDQSFTPPDGGGFPERMDMPIDGGMQPGNGIPGQSADNTVQWIWILLCAGVLLAGIAVVKVYRHW